MNQFQSQLNKAKHSVRFAPERKAALRHKLAAYMSLRPTNARQGVWHLHFNRLTYIPALMILLVVVGAGAAVAAGTSLPGSPLYVVKTHVNEPVRGALISDDYTRAAYEAELAARRVEEANQLATQGKLNEQIEAQLTTSLDNHVRHIGDRVDQLQAKQTQSAEVQEHLTNAQSLLKEARTKMQSRNYPDAARLGQQAAQAARQLPPGAVKGENTRQQHNNKNLP